MKQLDVSKINKLILLIADDYKKALDTLFEYTYDNMKIVAEYYLSNKSDLEDVLSQLYENIVRYAKSFDKERNGYSWMFAILRNLTKKENSRYKVFIDHYIGCDDIVDTSVDPLREVILEEAFSILSEKEKTILYRSFWEGYTIAEIAEEMNLPVSTVYNIRLRIYDKLSPYMSDEIKLK